MPHDDTSRPAPGPSDAALRSLRERLLAAVRRCSPPWIANQAEDIVQAALIRLSQSCSGGGGFEALGASYLETVARNAIIDETRRRFRRPEVPLGDDAARGPVPRGAVDRPADGALDLDRALRSCMATLGAARRAAVACRLLGYSVREAAEVLQWSVKKVEHLALRGMDDLRSCLEAKGVRP